MSLEKLIVTGGLMILSDLLTRKQSATVKLFFSTCSFRTQKRWLDFGGLKVEDETLGPPGGEGESMA